MALRQPSMGTKCVQFRKSCIWDSGLILNTYLEFWNALEDIVITSLQIIHTASGEGWGCPRAYGRKLPQVGHSITRVEVEPPDVRWHWRYESEMIIRSIWVLWGQDFLRAELKNTHTRTHTELSSLSPWRVLDFMICLCLLSLVCNLNSFPCLGVWDFPDPCYYGEHFVFPFSLSTSFPDCSQTLARSLQSVSYYHVMCGFYCSLLVMELGTRRHSLVLYFECCFEFVFFSLWEAC